MTALALHFASGRGFFSGAGLILIALLLVSASRRRLLQRLASLLGLLGALLVGLSAIPTPLWLGAAGIASLALWLGMEGRHRSQGPQQPEKVARGLVMLRVVVALIGLLAVGLELPFHCRPRPPVVKYQRLCIIGDSISAGMEEPGEVTWPDLFREQHAVQVIDLAQMGATVASALRQADHLDGGNSLVLLEIGGNDLLGTTPAAEFEAGLQRLLRKVTAPGRTVVMFELPLPPLANRYGAVQRRQAKAHGAILIPRRYFASVFAGEQMTLDGLHLSRRGHQRMADLVWRLLGDLLISSSPGSTFRTGDDASGRSRSSGGMGLPENGQIVGRRRVGPACRAGPRTAGGLSPKEGSHLLEGRHQVPLGKRDLLRQNRCAARVKRSLVV